MYYFGEKFWLTLSQDYQCKKVANWEHSTEILHSTNKFDSKYTELQPSDASGMWIGVAHKVNHCHMMHRLQICCPNPILLGQNSNAYSILHPHWNNMNGYQKDYYISWETSHWTRSYYLSLRATFWNRLNIEGWIREKLSILLPQEVLPGISLSVAFSQRQFRHSRCWKTFHTFQSVELRWSDSKNKKLFQR